MLDSFFLWSFTVAETSYHVIQTNERPCGKVLRSPAYGQQGNETCQSPCGWTWKQKPASLPQLSLQMTTAPSSSLIATCGGPWARITWLSQSQITGPQKLWDNKCILFWAASFGGNLLYHKRWLKQSWNGGSGEIAEGLNAVLIHFSVRNPWKFLIWAVTNSK